MSKRKQGIWVRGRQEEKKVILRSSEELSHPLTETSYSRSYLGELHCSHLVNIVTTEPILWKFVSLG